MSVRLLIGATASIWIVIKLPQEWWIHIATLDVASMAFFLFLVTLLVTLYDRYRPEFLARFPTPGREAA